MFVIHRMPCRPIVWSLPETRAAESFSALPVWKIIEDCYFPVFEVARTRKMKQTGSLLPPPRCFSELPLGFS